MSRWDWLRLGGTCLYIAVACGLVAAVASAHMPPVWAVLVGVMVVSASLDWLVNTLRWIERRERRERQR